jgi:hypothetical protein
MDTTQSDSRTSRTLASISAFGFSVDIKARKGQRSLVLEYMDNGERVRKSARTPDLDKAKARATVLAREFAKLEFGEAFGLEVPDDGQLDLETLFALFRRVKMKHMKPPRAGHTASYKGQVDVTMRVMTMCLGGSFKIADFDQNTIRRVVAWRIDPANRLRISGKNKGGVPPTEKTAIRDLTQLREIVNWAIRTRVNGRYLMTRNPLHGLKLPSPKAKCLRPISSEQRLTSMLDAAPKAEAAAREAFKGRNHGVPGFYAMLLHLLADAGHRVTATAMLQRQDVLRTSQDVAEAAALYGLQPEDCARTWRWGALHFRHGNDKMGRTSLIPLSRRLRRLLDAYLLAMDLLGRTAPDIYLFCMPTDELRPLVGSSVNQVLRNIEKAAVFDGGPLTHLKGGMAHPFRRRFRTIRAGRFDDKLVAIAGGWTLADPSAMNTSYLIFPPESTLQCLEFDPVRDLNENSFPPGVRIRVNMPADQD